MDSDGLLLGKPSSIEHHIPVTGLEITTQYKPPLPSNPPIWSQVEKSLNDFLRVLTVFGSLVKKFASLLIGLGVTKVVFTMFTMSQKATYSVPFLRGMHISSQYIHLSEDEV